MHRLLWLVVVMLLLAAAFASADTFMHRSTKKILHGYPTGKKENGKTVIHTEEEGQIAINLADYNTKQDHSGRNNTVAVISIPTSIALELETEAFEKALKEESEKGHLLILIEIDTPGGRIDLTKRICRAISQVRNCQTVAFIKGGENGGAYSAGVALALACDKIYMAPNTVIGAATAMTHTTSGIPIDLEKVIGENVSEKIRSAWRDYLASLAQSGNRPALLAKAMESKDIEVLEVVRQNHRMFIEPFNKRSGDKDIRIWSPKGSLLTLPAQDAEKTGFIDKTVVSRDELLADLNAENAKVINNTKTDKARDLFRRLSAKVEKIYNTHNARIKQVELIRDAARARKLLQDIIRDLKYVLRLKKEYPDIEIDEQNLQEALSSSEALYQSIQSMRRKR